MNAKTAPLLLALIVSVGLLASAGAAAEIKRRADAPKPLPPAESLKQFRVPPGLRIELVASEPILADPVAICFGATGRIFVCEVHGYNLEGYLDVVQLNKTGVLDKTVRRIPASPEAKRRAEQQTYGTVKMLEDTDGDGRVDRSTVWADHLPPCYGVVPVRSGVIVLCAPDIVYLGDRDGDGQLDERETVFTGFGAGEMWSRINNPRWGVDNWIYCSRGQGDLGTIRGPHLAKPVHMGSTDFRFTADGSRLEPTSAGTHGFGLTLTDWGDRFIIANSTHALYAAPLPYRYLARNPYQVAPPLVANAADYYQVFPISQPHPWRRERGGQAAWVKFYGSREATAHGYFTASCSPFIYREATLPPEYHGNHFSCESQQNLVHRCLLSRDGLRYSVRRAPGEEQSEFLRSTEGWFRPVNLAAGPDGGLYIVDMYREIIEDYSAIPRYLQQQYGLIEGHDRGRIWRVTVPGVAVRKPNLAAAATAELITELSNPGAWWRQAAQRVLVERGDRSAVAALAELMRTGKTPQSRLHALYTLDALGGLDAELVRQALGDDHFAVRLHSLRLAEKWLDTKPELLADVVSMVTDRDVRVRLQMALSLGQSHHGQTRSALAQLAARDGADGWMRAAIVSSVADSAGQLLAAIGQLTEDAGDSHQLLSELAAVVGARHKDDEISALLRVIAGGQKKDGAEFRIACLTGLVEGLERGKSQALAAAAGRQVLGRLLASSSAEVRLLALRVAGLVKLTDGPVVQRAFAAAAKEALDSSRPLDARKAAVALLASAPYATLAATARSLLDPRQPLDLQLAAVAALSAADDPGVVSILLANAGAFTPNVQAAAVAAVFRRSSRLAGLLDAVEHGTVSLQSLSPLQRIQLLEHSDPEIRRRAAALISERAPRKSRALVERYRAALAGPRDVGRGEAVFNRVCARCHRLGGHGSQVGPDLASAQNRADESFLLDMLQPSARITLGYRTYVVADTDGRVFTGLLASETATSVTLRAPEPAVTAAGKVIERTVLRKDIEAMKASDQSLMPDNLEKEVTPRDAADLIAYLRQTLGPVVSPVLTLFEDDASFVAALDQGSGRAALEEADTFSGAASLLVTPPQRYSPGLPGWRYPITEKPGPGQFRYLRLAWKSRGGAGVMIELAAAGGWPRADQPARRYYSGSNTTAWKAMQISDQAPTEWTVVTRDLWQDCGEFVLTGIAPTAMGGAALFDHIELLRSLNPILSSSKNGR